MQPIGGRLRQRIEDFIVEEIPPKETLHEKLQKNKYGEEEGVHTVFWMEKFNWDTNMAVKEIARKLHVSVSRIGFAGTKDKRAVTRQRVSVWNVPKEQIEKLTIKGIKLYGFEESQRKIRLGDSEGNRFTITIRDIDLSEEETKRRLEEIFAELKAGIPNLFGPQRFGEVRRLSHTVGLLMMKKDFEQACKVYIARAFEGEPEDVFEIRKAMWERWERKEAFKRGLKEYPARLKYERSMLDYLSQHPDDFCGALRRLPVRLRKMFINALQADIWNRAVEGERLNAGQKEPLPGYDTKLDEKDPIQKKMKKIMAEMGITKGHFKMAGMPEIATSGGERDVLLIPRNLQVLEIGKDEFNEGKTKAKISFELPSGSYATIVLEKMTG
ncbi:MAG: tRNA pseudouridine(13) synthase TruD [Candidatus Aenigmatarchaeota archaeon]